MTVSGPEKYSALSPSPGPFTEYSTRAADMNGSILGNGEAVESWRIALAKDRSEWRVEREAVSESRGACALELRWPPTHSNQAAY